LPFPIQHGGNRRLQHQLTPHWPAVMPPCRCFLTMLIPNTADPVAEAQQLLMKLGYNVGTPDGKLGSRTANAIRLFQLQVGMRVTGNVSPDLLEAMRTKAGA